MPTEDEIRKCVLLARGMQEDEDKAHIPPTGRALLMHAATEGGKKWGDPHPAARAYTAMSGAGGGPPETAARAPSAWSRERDGRGIPQPAAIAN